MEKMIVVNFKNYKKGKEVLKFAKKINNKCVIAAVPTTNIQEVSSKTNLITYAQHIDNKTSTRDTGFTIASSTKSSGAQGTILNHSEHKIPIKEIASTIKECKKQELNVIVCASSLAEASKLKKLKPFAIAYEDPKLIATGKSITDHDPISILKFVKLLSKTKIFPLCGAGINKKQDVENAIKLGCAGVLISSAMLKSKDPSKFLNQIEKA